MNVTNNSRIKITFALYLDMIISIIGFLSILIFNNSQESLKYFGIVILIISLHLIFKVKSNTNLLFLFGIILYINISVVLGDLFQIGQVLSDETLSWQTALRMSEYNAIGAKSIVILMSVLNLMINSEYLRKISTNVSTLIIKKDNKYIFYAGFLILLIFWYYGYESSIGTTYLSTTRSTYEYCLIIFIVVWFYSGDSKMKRYILYFYAIIYILQGLIRGDRSSAFPMLVILFLLQNYEINIKKLFVLAIGGITASNIVSVYRISFSISGIKELYASKYGMTAFLSDTVSQSYYTGISIIKARELVPFSSVYFIDFLGGVLFGGGFRNADVGAVSNNYLLNKGGGFYFSWFYFWFGTFGVVFSSILLGYFIRKFFSSTNNYIKLYQLTLVAMSFRWYLYTPFVLFRSVLFLLSVLLILTNMMERITKKSNISNSIKY